MTDKNLSEQLFKPKFDYPETSTLVTPSANTRHLTNSLLDSEGQSYWYRAINRLSWQWRGLPFMETEDVLSRIAISDKKRSNPNWLDTVIGYQSGNWIYEFWSQATKWQKQADNAEQADVVEADSQQHHSTCFQSWLMASSFMALAGFPYFRNDDLANQAVLLAYRYYRQAMEHSPYIIKELDFHIEDKCVKTILHTPLKRNDEIRAFPTVILCTGLSNLQIDFYRLFEEYLAPLGIGLLTVDMPSIGNSKSFNLTQNTSIIHQAIIEQIKTIPLIDYQNIILFGYRFGANIATRLAYLMPSKIKGIINIGPIIHQLFTDPQMQLNLPTIYRDMLVNRLGMKSFSEQQLRAELKFFSLKEQRLLIKPCNVPILNIYYEGDPLNNLTETKLITSTKPISLFKIKSSSLKQDIKLSSNNLTNWLKNLVS